MVYQKKIWNSITYFPIVLNYNSPCSIWNKPKTTSKKLFDEHSLLNCYCCLFFLSLWKISLMINNKNKLIVNLLRSEQYTPLIPAQCSKECFQGFKISQSLIWCAGTLEYWVAWMIILPSNGVQSLFDRLGLKKWVDGLVFEPSKGLITS